MPPFFDYAGCESTCYDSAGQKSAELGGVFVNNVVNENDERKLIIR